jgi:hypothetical protein
MYRKLVAGNDRIARRTPSDIEQMVFQLVMGYAPKVKWIAKARWVEVASISRPLV